MNEPIDLFAPRLQSERGLLSRIFHLYQDKQTSAEPQTRLPGETFLADRRRTGKIYEFVSRSAQPRSRLPHFRYRSIRRTLSRVRETISRKAPREIHEQFANRIQREL